MIDLTRDVELRAQVCNEVTRCIALAEARYGRCFLQPLVTFNLTRRAAGMAVLREVRIEINMDVLRADPEHVIKVTAAHEVAHLVHFQMRPWDFKKGSRLAHGPTWRSIMRVFGVDAARVYKPAPAVLEQLEATRARVSRVHQYRCPGCSALMSVGARQHGQLLRGATFRHIACKTRFCRDAHVGLHPQTTAALEARR
jgi:predicted SprT family Zn-dependent metalloprotease